MLNTAIFITGAVANAAAILMGSRKAGLDKIGLALGLISLGAMVVVYVLAQWDLEFVKAKAITGEL